MRAPEDQVSKIDRSKLEADDEVAAGEAAAGEAPPSESPLLAEVFAPIRPELGALQEYLTAEFGARDPFLGDLLEHMAKFSGKLLRPACVLLAGRTACERLGLDHLKVAAVVELIHTATLVHDDLLDDARLRRKVITIHERWGERAAVLLGDFIYSRGFTISTEVPGVSGSLAATTHTICEGELLQLGTAFDVNLGEERYYEIIRKKTAVLYALACRLGAQLAGASPEMQERLERYGQSIGMAFQIIDDALDLAGDEYVVGKTLGSDLHKGKLTLPLIRLREALKGGRLEEYLWLLKTPHALGAHVRVLRMVKEAGVLASVRATAERYLSEAIEQIAPLPDSPAKRALGALSRFVVERQH